MIRGLRGVIEREGAAIGVFLALTEPSRPMITEAAGAGQYALPGTDLSVPCIQIVTIEQAMELRDRAVRVPFGSGQPQARGAGGGSEQAGGAGFLSAAAMCAGGMGPVGVWAARR